MEIVDVGGGPGVYAAWLTELGHRVLRPGGLLVAAAISRFAALHDLLSRTDRLFEPHVRDAVERAVETGVFRVTADSPFTTAYFHTADDLRDELEDAGMAIDGLFNVEGPAGFLPDLDQRWADDGRRALMLWAARLVESEPSLIGAAAHLLAVGRRARD